MNSTCKGIGVLLISLLGMFAANHLANFSNVMVAQECTCGLADCGGSCGSACRTGCRKCGSTRGCRKCPKCDVECCQLEVKTGETKETCFQTEQKIVCIPRVRLPWQACCPPTKSRTRTVKVLKTHTFKCPSCEYKWSVVEPEIPEPEGDKSKTGVAVLSDRHLPDKQLPQLNQLPYENLPVAYPTHTSAGSNSPPVPRASFDPSVPAGSR